MRPARAPNASQIKAECQRRELGFAPSLNLPAPRGPPRGAGGNILGAKPLGVLGGGAGGGAQSFETTTANVMVL